MARRKYAAVGEDLVPHADAVADHFTALGYVVHVERQELGFPGKPTLVCTRDRMTVIVEVEAKPPPRVEDWVGYCKSSGRDTRIAVCLPQESALTVADETRLQDAGVGLYVSEGTRVVERFTARDLGLNVELPKSTSLPRTVRRLLGAVYEQFGRGSWREGFEQACKVLEAEARTYLMRGLKTGRITLIMKSGKVRSLRGKQINKMTLGALAETFHEIASKTQADSILGETLKLINKDRVGIAHHPRKAITERRLRANVGHHMWRVVGALKEMNP